MSNKRLDRSLEFRREVYAEKVNFAFLSLRIVFKAMRLNKIIEKMIVGRKEIKTKDQILQHVNINIRMMRRNQQRRQRKSHYRVAGKPDGCPVLESK